MENINLKYMTKAEAEVFYNLEQKSYKQALERIATFMYSIKALTNKVKKAVEAKELDIGQASPLNYAKKIFSLRLAEVKCTKHFINNNLRYAGNEKALEVWAFHDAKTTLENIEKSGVTNAVELVQKIKDISPPKTSNKGVKVSTGKVKVTASNSKELFDGMAKQLINLNKKHLIALRNKIDEELKATQPKDVTPVKNVA